MIGFYKWTPYLSFSPQSEGKQADFHENVYWKATLSEFSEELQRCFHLCNQLVDNKRNTWLQREGKGPRKFCKLNHKLHA